MSATISSDLLNQAFSTLSRDNRRALVVYVTAGHPDRAQSVELLQALASAGADVIEVGVPFSDPMADGPVIQRASQIALEQGTGLHETLRIVRDAALEIPVVLFSYLNPVLAAGPQVLQQAMDHGVHGVLITDLPVGADAERERWLGESGLAFVRLVAPTTPTDRMREIARHGRGFVYLISRLGVTGARDDVPAELGETIARLRGVCELPICAGFGISTPAQAAQVGRVADGVVVGSAVVRAAEAGVSQAAAVVAAMRGALDTL